jgi:hypothetical protein
MGFGIVRFVAVTRVVMTVVVVAFVIMCGVVAPFMIVTRVVMPGVIMAFMIVAFMCVLVRTPACDGAPGATGPARRAFIITRPQALRSGKPRQEALIHRPTLPNVTQSLNSL